jgi:tRNA-Thr(GGU) m(6)t(6)A37 methyltransferase TsaA
MEEITYKSIGTIRSPFKEREDMPIQPCGAVGVAGTVELREEFTEGLKDLDGFSHLILIYHFHLSRGFDLEIEPFLDGAPHGVFSTRAPRRPNPIGLSVVKLVGIKGRTLQIENADIIDGTPLLDIKPYVSAFDGVEDERIGWLSERVKHAEHKRSDERFR